VTKKEIVKRIADEIDETQLKTKEIVQLTFDAIVDTLISARRIELRNFGVFEVKLRKARKARNPRTNDHVDVPPKYVVTFKPGKEMEEKVGKLKPTQEELAALEARGKKDKGKGKGKGKHAEAAGDSNGVAGSDGQPPPRKKRARKATQA
jgi:integration host factor subunit beta